MPQNGGIWLNMVERVWIGREYAWIYNNRQDSDMPMFLIHFMQYIVWGHSTS